MRIVATSGPEHGLRLDPTNEAASRSSARVALLPGSPRLRTLVAASSVMIPRASRTDRDDSLWPAPFLTIPGNPHRSVAIPGSRTACDDSPVGAPFVMIHTVYTHPL